MRWGSAALFTLAAALATVLTSCGGQLPFAATATRDPLTGIFIARGGGGALDAVDALTKAFSAKHPGVAWQGLDDIGSDAGLKLVSNGGIDLSFISRELRPAELGTVVTVPIGTSGTGLAVSAANPVTAIHKDELAQVYRGDVSNWRYLGGKDEVIHVLLREIGAATRTAFEAYCFGGKPPASYAKNAIEVGSYDEMIRAMKSFPSSIGMMSISAQALAEPSIHLLTVDGVAATREALNSGAYPMRRPLYLAYSADPASVKPTIRAFVDFVKGPEGQAVLGSI